jgi:hypothetical protein
MVTVTFFARTHGIDDELPPILGDRREVAVALRLQQIEG